MFLLNEHADFEIDYEINDAETLMAAIAQDEVEYLTESHNINMAMAKFEHKVIVENSSVEVFNEGAMDWLTRAKNAIVNFFKKMKAKFMKFVSTKSKGQVENIRRWLRENKSKIGKTKDDVEIETNLNKIGSASGAVDTAMKSIDHEPLYADIGKLTSAELADTNKAKKSLKKKYPKLFPDESGIKTINDTFYGTSAKLKFTNFAQIETDLDGLLVAVTNSDYFTGALNSAEKSAIDIINKGEVSNGSEKLKKQFKAEDRKIALVQSCTADLMRQMVLLFAVASKYISVEFSILQKSVGKKGDDDKDKTTVQNNSTSALDAFL
jgi:hypothetical protein